MEDENTSTSNKQKNSDSETNANENQNEETNAADACRAAERTCSASQCASLRRTLSVSPCRARSLSRRSLSWASQASAHAFAASMSLWKWTDEAGAAAAMERSEALRTLGFTSRQPASSNANTGLQSPRCCRAKACNVSKRAIDACLLMSSGGGLFPSGWTVAAKDNGW